MEVMISLNDITWMTLKIIWIDIAIKAGTEGIYTINDSNDKSLWLEIKRHFHFKADILTCIYV